MVLPVRAFGATPKPELFDAVCCLRVVTHIVVLTMEVSDVTVCVYKSGEQPKRILYLIFYCVSRCVNTTPPILDLPCNHDFHTASVVGGRVWSWFETGLKTPAWLAEARALV